LYTSIRSLGFHFYGVVGLNTSRWNLIICQCSSSFS